jgi:arylsulfatase A-like enzyme
MGPGIRPGEYPEPATPADVVPTLASLAGISLARVEGRRLDAALSSKP